MKTQPDIARGRDRVIEARAIWEHVLMIRGQSAAAGRQFGQPKHAGMIKLFGPEPAPNGIQILQPPEKQRVLTTRHCFGQTLEQVVMRVH